MQVGGFINTKALNALQAISGPLSEEWCFAGGDEGKYNLLGV